MEPTWIAGESLDQNNRRELVPRILFQPPANFEARHIRQGRFDQHEIRPKMRAQIGNPRPGRYRNGLIALLLQKLLPIFAFLRIGRIQPESTQFIPIRPPQQAYAGEAQANGSFTDPRRRGAQAQCFTPAFALQGPREEATGTTGVEGGRLLRQKRGQTFILFRRLKTKGSTGLFLGHSSNSGIFFSMEGKSALWKRDLTRRTTTDRSPR